MENDPVAGPSDRGESSVKNGRVRSAHRSQPKPERSGAKEPTSKGGKSGSGETRTSRSTCSRRMIIMEEFSESEVQITTPSGEYQCQPSPPPSEGHQQSGDHDEKQPQTPESKQKGVAQGREMDMMAMKDELLQLAGASPRHLKPSVEINQSQTEGSSPANTNTVVTEDSKHEFDDVETITVVENVQKNDVSHQSGRGPSMTEEESQFTSPKTTGEERFKKTATTINNALIATRPSRRASFAFDTQSPRSRRRPNQRDSDLTMRRKSFGYDPEERMKMSTIEESILYEIIKPLFIALKVFGLFYVKKQKIIVLGEEQRYCSRVRWHHAIYCWTMFAVYVINLVRAIWALVDMERLDFPSAFEISWCIIWFDSVMRSLFCLIFCWSESKNLKQLFAKIEQTCYGDGIVPYEQSLSKFMWYFLGISGIGLIVSFGITVYGMFFNDALLQLYAQMWPIHVGDLDSWAIVLIKICILVMMTYTMATALLTVSLFSVVAYVLYKEFEYFCRTLSRKITAEGNFPEDLGRIRMNHQARCKLAEATDGIFKYFLAIAYLTNTPPLCLLGYALLEPDLELAYTFLGAYWFIWFLYQLIAISAIAIGVNTQINIFMNRLTGTSIGLSAWDMWILNKPTLLTVIGMIITYFFLLVQFRNPLASETKGGCNCTLSAVPGDGLL